MHLLIYFCVWWQVVSIVSTVHFLQFREELCEDVVTNLAHMMREECLIASKADKEKPDNGKLILTRNEVIIGEVADRGSHIWTSSISPHM